MRIHPQELNDWCDTAAVGAVGGLVRAVEAADVEVAAAAEGVDVAVVVEGARVAVAEPGDGAFPCGHARGSGCPTITKTGAWRRRACAIAHCPCCCR